MFRGQRRPASAAKRAIYDLEAAPTALTNEVFCRSHISLTHETEGRIDTIVQARTAFMQKTDAPKQGMGSETFQRKATYGVDVRLLLRWIITSSAKAKRAALMTWLTDRVKPST